MSLVIWQNVPAHHRSKPTEVLLAPYWLGESWTNHPDISSLITELKTYTAPFTLNFHQRMDAVIHASWLLAIIRGILSENLPLLQAIILEGKQSPSLGHELLQQEVNTDSVPIVYTTVRTAVDQSEYPIYQLPSPKPLTGHYLLAPIYDDKSCETLISKLRDNPEQLIDTLHIRSMTSVSEDLINKLLLELTHYFTDIQPKISRLLIDMPLNKTQWHMLTTIVQQATIPCLRLGYQTIQPPSDFFQWFTDENSHRLSTLQFPPLSPEQITLLLRWASHEKNKQAHGIFFHPNQTFTENQITQMIEIMRTKPDTVFYARTYHMPGNKIPWLNLARTNQRLGAWLLPLDFNNRIILKNRCHPVAIASMLADWLKTPDTEPLTHVTQLVLENTRWMDNGETLMQQALATSTVTKCILSALPPNSFSAWVAAAIQCGARNISIDAGSIRKFTLNPSAQALTFHDITLVPSDRQTIRDCLTAAQANSTPCNIEFSGTTVTTESLKQFASPDEQDPKQGLTTLLRDYPSEFLTLQQMTFSTRDATVAELLVRGLADYLSGEAPTRALPTIQLGLPDAALPQLIFLKGTCQRTTIPTAIQVTNPDGRAEERHVRINQSLKKPQPSAPPAEIIAPQTGTTGNLATYSVPSSTQVYSTSYPPTSNDRFFPPSPASTTSAQQVSSLSSTSEVKKETEGNDSESRDGCIRSCALL